MSDDALYTISEVAQKLGVQRAAVHAMVRRGKIAARRVGNRYLIDTQELHRAELLRRPKSRPLTPRHAWAALAMLSGDTELERTATRGLSSSARSRLRARIATTRIPDLAPLLHIRASTQRYQADEDDIDKLRRAKGVVLTGESAARTYNFDVTAVDHLEAYVTRERALELIHDYILEPSIEANVTLRIIEDAWPFDRSRLVAPKLIAALDISESTDPRARRAGVEILQQWNRDQ